MLKSAAPQWCSRDTHVVLSTGGIVGSFAPTLEQAGYEILHLPFAKNFSFFRRLAALINEGSYDIVHIHTARAAPIYAAVAGLMVRNRPVVFRTVHHLFRFDGLLRVRKKLERKLMKHLLGVRFLSNSPSGMRNERRRYGMSNTYAPNWYDSDLFTPPTDEDARKARAGLGWPEDLTVFVSLGGNWFYKNYDRIVRALALIPEEHHILYVQIGVQGKGSPLERLAEYLGVQHRLQCTGVVNDILPMLWAADAYLMPSSEEGFGIAAVEAMAAGTPAILGNVEALTDFKETVEGIRYVEPETDAIAGAMTEFVELGRPELRELGLIQAKNVKAHYGLETAPRIYQQAWSEACLSASATTTSVP